MTKSPIRYRKIRGINRRKRLINEWGERYKSLDIEKLQKLHRDYVKFWVRPWSDSLLINSVPAEPAGELETLLIANLIKIYQSWESTLKQLEEPYYLAAWLFEQSLSRSQVLCTIKQPMDFSNVFRVVETQPKDGIKSSVHYNEATAVYLDCYQWTLYRYIQFYNLSDPEDRAVIESFDSQCLLGPKTLGQTEYQAVEVDRVWIID